MFTQPGRVDVVLPDWLRAYAAGYAPSMDLESRMAFVVEAARRNVAARTGGPFAAAVFEIDSGALVALGVNLVTSQGLSMLHAELVALALAQRKLGDYDLGAPGMPAHELVASAEPCAMCLGAIPWSGVGRMISGATGDDVTAIGFDEGLKPPAWDAGLRVRGIEVQTGILRGDAVRVLEDYARGGGAIYNGRSRSE